MNFTSKILNIDLCEKNVKNVIKTKLSFYISVKYIVRRGPMVCQNRRRHRNVKRTGQNVTKWEIDKICFTVSPLTHITKFWAFSFSKLTRFHSLSFSLLGSPQRTLASLLWPALISATNKQCVGIQALTLLLHLPFEFWKKKAASHFGGCICFTLWWASFCKQVSGSFWVFVSL